MRIPRRGQGPHAVRLGLTTILLLLAGCGAPGVLITEQLPNQYPFLGTAPQDGNYGLFMSGRDDPLFTFNLTQGQPLGFRITETGTVGDVKIQWLNAVAGDRQIHLDASSSYQWRRL